MIPMTIEQLAHVVSGALRGVEGTVPIDEVATDTRTLRPAHGASPLFVARRGRDHDGHDHAAAAIDRGAVAVLGSRALPGLPCVVVDDPDRALVVLARHVRDTVDPVVVGITGSAGKTTTKDLTAAACGPTRRTVAAEGSYNNEMGVPLTMLATCTDTEVLVTEMGARGIGQVAELAAWARPDIGVVTLVAGVHLERFGTLEEVARAKAELVTALPQDGTAVLNSDDARVEAMGRSTAAAVLRCSAAGRQDAEVIAADVRLDDRARARFVARTPWGTHPVALPVAGRHQIINALCALAAAGAAGADVAAAAAAMGHAHISPWRGAIEELDGITLFDDAYNASPTSTLAALDALAAMKVTGRRLAVLGVMAEIGPDHEREHARVGARAAAVLDRLVVVGDDAVPLAAAARAAALPTEVVDDPALALAALGPIEPGDAILVKASRVARLDLVTTQLRGAHS